MKPSTATGNTACLLFYILFTGISATKPLAIKEDGVGITTVSSLSTHPAFPAAITLPSRTPAPSVDFSHEPDVTIPSSSFQTKIAGNRKAKNTRDHPTPVKLHIRQTGSGPAATSSGSYVYAGCYGSTSGFPSFSKVDTTRFNTVELCTSECLALGKPFAGLRKTSCYCASSLDAGDTREVDQVCTAQCPGNPNESCGGPDIHGPHIIGAPSVLTTLFDVYEFIPTSLTSSLKPTATPIVGTCEYSGCYGSSSGFPLFSLVDTTRFMTVELCTAECSGSGRAFAGIQKTKCYCASALDVGDVKELDGYCSSPCPGNSAESCGGPTIHGPHIVGAPSVLTTVFDVYECMSSTTSTTSSTTSSGTPNPSSDPDSTFGERSVEDEFGLNPQFQARDNSKARRGGMLKNLDRKEKGSFLGKRNFGLRAPFGLEV